MKLKFSKNDLVIVEPKICAWEGCLCLSVKTKRFCSKHAHQYRKQTNPLLYYFYSHKANAKRRGKEWTITLEQWKEFCNKENFLELKAEAPGFYSLDRIRAEEGYHADNIQVLTVPQNSRKKYVDQRLSKGIEPTEQEQTEFYNI